MAKQGSPGPHPTSPAHVYPDTLPSKSRGNTVLFPDATSTRFNRDSATFSPGYEEPNARYFPSGHFPSGDHERPERENARSVGRWRALLPSRFTITICVWLISWNSPVAGLVIIAMRCPSGDHAKSLTCRAPAVSLWGTSDSSAVTVQRRVGWL